MRKLLLLRPGAGLAASLERAQALGLEAIARPLFQIEPIDWSPPDPAGFDALLLTSANAVRQAGTGLERLSGLPVHAVGEATATAAREAGLQVETVGATDVTGLLSQLPASLRLLHLAGEDHRDVADPRIERRIVYRSTPIAEPGLPALDGLVIAIHSPRAGVRLAELASDRSAAAIAAISGPAASACGSGWERIEVADLPTDERLLALAASLCHTSAPR